MQVPDFKLATTLNRDIKLTDYAGQNIVLYFYPKDNTPGCTVEAQDFTASMSKFSKANTVILGVSRDSLAKHIKFKAKHCMPFELISDPESQLCEYFNVIKDKSLFGVSYKGIERSTFLINAKGEVVKEWRKVKVRGHVDEVLSAVQELC